VVLENDCHTASLMPHFDIDDIVHAVIPCRDPTLRKWLRTIHETALVSKSSYVDIRLTRNRSGSQCFVAESWSGYIIGQVSVYCLYLYNVERRRQRYL